MKKCLLVCLLASTSLTGLHAQCTTANVNWDNLKFLVNTGGYAAFITAAQTQDQRFAFGPGILRVQTTSNITINGENTTFTGQSNSYGSGASASFATTTTSGISSITLSFGSSAVTSLRFSLYDLDNDQRATVMAYNGSTAISSTLSKANNTSGASIGGSPGTAPHITGIAGDYLVSDDRGSFNVDIAGPVTSVVIKFTSATGDFWLSDLQACVPGSFSTDYYSVSQPWPGQPSYVTSTPDTNLVVTVNPANGATKTIFKDPASVYLNSMGYDPYNHFLYYALDGTASGAYHTALKKYDYNTETIVPVLSNVSSIGIPTFDFGVESGAAAFYDGCYYMGIEGGNSTANSGRKSIVWRVEFDASNNPVSASQVFAIAADDGVGTNTHDWGDFVIKDGILYDWNSRPIGGNYYTYQYNLQTQALTTQGPMTFVPKQVAQTWDGKIYQLSTGVRLYNGTTGYAAAGYVFSGACWIGSAGDGSEAYKPKADYGDAPASYDPSTSPAVHEMDTTLRLGATMDREWEKEGATTMADADGADEDGIGSMPLLCPCSANFMVSVKVYNHTGANATLIGWLDYNGNRQFDASEAISITVGSSTALQTVTLNWTDALTTYPNLTTTYLRIRLTSAGNGMTTANPTGYFANGEVEDYRVFVNGFPLATNLLNFTVARTAGDGVKATWKAAEDESLNHYYLQRSANGIHWTNLVRQTASGKNSIANYSYDDAAPGNGMVYYRLQAVNTDGMSKLSDVRQLAESRFDPLSLWPNPVHKTLTVNVKAGSAGNTSLQIVNEAGVVVSTQNVYLVKGPNSFSVDVSSFAKGMYQIRLHIAKEWVTQSFVRQ